MLRCMSMWLDKFFLKLRYGISNLCLNEYKKYAVLSYNYCTNYVRVILNESGLVGRWFLWSSWSNLAGDWLCSVTIYMLGQISCMKKWDCRIRWKGLDQTFSFINLISGRILKHRCNGPVFENSFWNLPCPWMIVTIFGMIHAITLKGNNDTKKEKKEVNTEIGRLHKYSTVRIQMGLSQAACRNFEADVIDSRRG